MTKLQKLIIERSVKPNTTLASVTTVAIIAFSTLLVLFAGSTSTISAYAEQTDTINASKLINASKDKVWNIVSDVDNNPDYWPISIVKNISKTNNTVEREVTIPAPPFMDNKVHQMITINPEQYTVIENQTQGVVTGVKTISLLQAGNDANKTEISVVWNLDLSKIPGFGKAFAKDGMSNSVDEALNKIANASK
ncbi:MAG: SRPBCC family protein [Candidatus Nitrosocosmicus sp.]|nr:SRPBCC family protein [Candidatus Nitrosocosmicus sp.]MDN5868695.1 SRPBCC family protein [Candidatus Nitrosocosmicus sp.]